eukprot:CAMPEP_0173302142 /NCGR_PEP_ID=MMETSP1143-20121109/18185_1 /TAXON_ID=483371 /ORGANISM="non described non described, Strain CCMP2298" /LENGTH=64 /DNA_ID=CAMNT_0014242739 /DNA_START=511 /DNA_END=701 /DNA_ORIENTATION=+
MGMEDFVLLPIPEYAGDQIAPLDRTYHPPRGREGVWPSATAALRVAHSQQRSHKAEQSIHSVRV